MGHLIFIAAAKDSNSVLVNPIDVDTIEELREELTDSIEESVSLYVNRWYIDFEEVDLNDLGIDEEELELIFNECNKNK